MSKPMSFSDLTDLLVEANPTVHGFIVSQEVYDALRARLPQKFAGGNCFGSTPIVVDPKLEGADCGVAFTYADWHSRLQEI